MAPSSAVVKRLFAQRLGFEGWPLEWNLGPTTEGLLIYLTFGLYIENEDPKINILPTIAASNALRHGLQRFFEFGLHSSGCQACLT